MHAQHQGRDVLLTFNEDFGHALAKACELDRDVDAVHLGRAANIVRRHIIGDAEEFNGFPAGCQQDSVPPMLLGLVNMILEGPSENTTPAALTIHRTAPQVQQREAQTGRHRQYTSYSQARYHTGDASSDLHRPHATCIHAPEGAG